MDDFYRTRMGHEFFLGTMPGLVAQLKRLNDNLEKLLILEEAKHAHEAAKKPEGDGS